MLLFCPDCQYPQGVEQSTFDLTCESCNGNCPYEEWMETTRKIEKGEKMEIKKFSEVLPVLKQLEGEQVKKEDILDKEFILKDYILIPSSYDPEKEFPILQIEIEGKLCTCTGGVAIKNQLSKIGKDKLPIRAMIAVLESKEHRRYFVLADPNPQALFLCPLCKRILKYKSDLKAWFCITCDKTYQQAKKEIIKTFG